MKLGKGPRERICELQCVILPPSAPYTHGRLSLLSTDHLSYGIYVINAITAADYCKVQGTPGSSSPPAHLRPCHPQRPRPVGGLSAQRGVRIGPSCSLPGRMTGEEMKERQGRAILTPAISREAV